MGKQVLRGEAPGRITPHDQPLFMVGMLTILSLAPVTPVSVLISGDEQ